MNYTEKRKAKKLARRMFVLAYATMIMWALVIIGSLVKLAITKGGGDISGIVIVVVGLAPFIAALVLGMVGQHYLNKRVAYKQGIDVYRQYRYFTNSINLILQGGKEAYDKAVETYELLHEGSSLRKFVFSFIVTSNYFSADEKLAKKGKKRLTEILDSYNPENVDLHQKISLF
jgi:hypothetical protein